MTDFFESRQFMSIIFYYLFEFLALQRTTDADSERVSNSLPQQKLSLCSAEWRHKTKTLIYRNQTIRSEISEKSKSASPKASISAKDSPRI